MKKLNNTEAELKNSVVYKKKACASLTFSKILIAVLFCKFLSSFKHFRKCRDKTFLYRAEKFLVKKFKAIQCQWFFA